MQLHLLSHPAFRARRGIRYGSASMSELDDQIQNRREKRQTLAAHGIPTYPHQFAWDLEPADVKARHGGRSV